MPSSNVDERVVQMRMDNEQFERGAERTIGTLGKLEQALHIKSDTTVFDGVQKAANNFSVSSMLHELDKLTARMTIVSDVTRKVFHEIESTVKGLTIDQVSEGLSKYEEKTASIQTIANSTGKSVEEISKYLDELMWFSDETSFSFTEMTAALAQMTSTGGDIEKSIPMIMGIGNAVAYAGKSGQEFVRTIRNLNQSYSAGYLTLMDWRSLQLAGTNSKALTEILIKTGEAMGKIKEGEVTLENFTDTLKEKWADKEVMEAAFGYFAEMSQKAKEMIDDTVNYPNIKTAAEAYEALAEEFDEIQVKAALSAQQAKSFKEMILAIKDAVSTGWMKTFEKFFGNLNEATEFWTEMYDRFDDLFVKGGKNRNSILDIAFGQKRADGSNLESIADGWEKLEKHLNGSGKSLDDFYDALKKVLASSPDSYIQNLLNGYGSIEEAFREGAITADIFRQVMAELNGETEDTAASVDTSANAMGQSLEELREVALGILRGDWGNGEERRKMLEEAGYDYELMQAMAGQLSNGNYWISDETLMDWMERYYRYNNLAAKYGAETFAEYLAMQQAAAAEAGHVNDKIDDLYDSITGVAGVEGDAIDRGWEFRQALLNIMDAIVNIRNAVAGAWTKVFGGVEERGARLGKIIDKFYDLSKNIGFSKDALTGLGKGFEWLFRAIKDIAKVGLSAFGKLGRGLTQVFGFLDTLLAKYGRGEIDLKKMLLGGEDNPNWISRFFGSLSGNFNKVLSIAKKFGTLVGGLLKDAVDGVKKLFSGGFSLPESMQNSETILGRIGGIVTDIFGTVTDFLKDFHPLDLLDSLLDKIGEVRTQIKEGWKFKDILRDFFNLGTEDPGGILGFFGRLFGLFDEESGDVSRSLHTIETSMDDFGDEVRGLGGVMADVTGVLEPISNLIFGDPEALRTKIQDFWTQVRETFQFEVGKINWETVMDTVKLGILAALGTKLFGIFDQMEDSLQFGTGKRGIIGSIREMLVSIRMPFVELSKAIERRSRADVYLKIAAAIGILAWSIMQLTKVDEQKFFNVAVVLGFLMMIMAKMAQVSNGISIFSNNTRTTSKNNSSAFSSLQNFGQNLKGFLALDFNNNTFNVFNSTAQILIACAILLVAVVYAILKLKDVATVDQIEKIWPVLAIIGGTFVLLGIIIARIASITSKSPYSKNMGKAGAVILALAITLILIVRSLISLSKVITSENIVLIIVAFLFVSGLIAGIIGVLQAAATLGSNARFASVIKPSSILAVAAVLLAIGIMVRSLIKSMAKASEITDVWKGLGVIIGLLLMLVVVLTIMDVIVTSNQDAGTQMLKVAGSMALLALAIAMLVPSIAILSDFPWQGLLGAAAALGILIGVMGGIVFLLSKVPTKKLLVAAAVFGVIAIAMGLLMAAASIFTSVMIGLVTQVPWEELGDRVHAFHELLAPEIPLMLALGAAVLMFGIGCAGAGVAAITFSASFALIAAGILLVAVALPKLIDGIVYFVQQLNQHGWEIVEFIGLIFVGILAVMAAKEGQLVTRVISLATKIIESLQDGVLISKVLSVIAQFGTAALTMLIAMAPILSDKLVSLIVNLVWSVAEALHAKSGELIAAFEALIGTLFSIGIKALANLAGDLLGFLGDFIAEIIRDVVPGGGVVADWIERNLGSEAFEGAIDVVSNAADRALERSFMNSSYKPHIETEGTATVTITEAEGRWRPGQDAEITFDDTIPVNVSSQNVEIVSDGAANMDQAVEVMVNEYQQELSGAGDSKGIPGATEEVFGDIGQYIPIDDLSSSLSGTLGGADILGTYTDAGEEGLLKYAGGFLGESSGDDATGLMSGGAGNLFSSFSTQFLTSSDEGTPGLAENLVTGLYNKIIEFGQNLLPSAGASLYNLVDGGVRDEGVIESPSKRMGENGYWMVMGLAKGLTDNADIAYDAGSDTASGLIDEFRQTMEKVALIASDDFEFKPTITPVVDLSNVQSAAGLMNGTLGGGFNVSAQMSGNISRRMSDAERVASGMETRAKAVSSTSNDIYNFNIYASDGMDEEAIADAVMMRMQTRMTRRSAAFG